MLHVIRNITLTHSHCSVCLLHKLYGQQMRVVVVFFEPPFSVNQSPGTSYFISINRGAARRVYQPCGIEMLLSNGSNFLKKIIILLLVVIVVEQFIIGIPEKPDSCRLAAVPQLVRA